MSTLISPLWIPVCKVEKPWLRVILLENRDNFLKSLHVNWANFQRFDKEWSPGVVDVDPSIHRVVQ